MRLSTKERIHASIGTTEVKTGLLQDNSFMQVETTLIGWNQVWR